MTFELVPCPNSRPNDDNHTHVRKLACTSLVASGYIIFASNTAFHAMPRSGRDGSPTEQPRITAPFWRLDSDFVNVHPSWDGSGIANYEDIGSGMWPTSVLRILYECAALRSRSWFGLDTLQVFACISVLFTQLLVWVNECS